MSATLLSTHSSNPLEAPPEDARNRAFVRTYQSTKAQPDIESDSSEYEKRRHGEGTVKAYQSHVAGLYKDMNGRPVRRGKEKAVDYADAELSARAGTIRGGILRQVVMKGKGRAVPQIVVKKESNGHQPRFVDLDEDMSDEGVPGVGECQLILDEDEDGQHAVSQDPAGSGNEDEGEVDTEMHDNEEVEHDLEGEDEVEVDLSSKHLDSAASSSSSAHIPSSSLSLLVKPPDEQQDIQIEMSDLEHAVPSLAETYRLIDRLGSGTFSSVYKAIDLHYDKYDNSVWERAGNMHHTAAPFVLQPLGKDEGEAQTLVRGDSQRKSGKVYVAVKRIYVTSGPERVKNELAIMEDCLGSRHSSQIITAFRHRDQVVAIMPYCRNEDFRVRSLAHFS